jgi:ribosome-associated protein
MARELPIGGEMVRLGELLKLSGLFDGGGEVKTFVADHELLVNREPETRRGRQLRSGDVVRAAD